MVSVVHSGETLLNALQLFASEGVPETIGPYSGAVGHFISAVLQTAGLYGQSDVLESFGPLLARTAGLFYFIAIIGALTSVALFGNYRRALLLIIGPVLFHMMLGSTMLGDATVIQVGQRINPDGASTQRKLLDMFTSSDPLTSDQEKYDHPITLSLFFVLYDNMISNIMQSTVGVLLDTQNREDIKIAVRERVLGMLFQPTDMRSAYLELISASTLGQCADETKLQFEIASLKKKNPTPPQPPGTPPPPETDPKIIALQTELKAKSAVQDKLLTQSELDYLQTLDVTKLVDLGMGIPASEWEAVLKQKVWSCDDIWKLVQGASIVEAGRHVDLTTSNCTPDATNEDGIPWDQVCQDIFESVASAGQELPPEEARKRAHQVIAAYVLRNAIMNTTHSQLLGQVFSHAPIDEDGKDYNEIFNSYLEADGQGALLALQYFEAVVPYLQGLLLFVLAAAMPFFAVLLVIPGKMQSFVVWMALWLWVKSWDVGFALVTVVRDVLWEYLGRGPTASGRGFLDINWDDPLSVIDVIANCDPLANANTYYILSSIMVIAVPAVTAQMCLGATEVYGALRNLFQTTGEGLQRQRTVDLRQQYANEYDKQIELRSNLARVSGAQQTMGLSKTGDASESLKAMISSRDKQFQYMQSAANKDLQKGRIKFTNRADNWSTRSEALLATYQAGNEAMSQLEAGNPLLGAQSMVPFLGSNRGGLPADFENAMLTLERELARISSGSEQTVPEVTGDSGPGEGT